jgi:phage-related protein
VFTKDKPLTWIGSSKKDLMALPVDVRKFFGFALDFAQRGDKHDAAKVLNGFGGDGVLELVEDDQAGMYMAVNRQVFQGGIRAALLQQKEQAWYRDTKRGYGHHSFSAQSGRGTCKGVVR